jgi:hypothetical protein
MLVTTAFPFGQPVNGWKFKTARKTHIKSQRMHSIKMIMFLLYASKIEVCDDFLFPPLHFITLLWQLLLLVPKIAFFISRCSDFSSLPP